jgi:predicted TIM-barrel fold metal-dependent hydrolase
MAMLKKSLLATILIGFLLLLFGLIVTPSFLAKFSPTGKFRSAWTLTEIILLKNYSIILGSTILLLASLIFLLPTEKKTIQILLGFFSLGIIVTVVGLIFSPEFVEKNLSPINYLEEDQLNILSILQLSLIILGCVIVLGSSLIYRRKFLISKKGYDLIIVLSVLVIFLSLFYSSYINSNYPSNILLKPGEYSKILKLMLGNDILLSDFDPQSTLVVQRKYITKAKYPVIDMNFHLQSAFQTEEDRRVLIPGNLIKSMDSVGLKIIVNTDGIEGNLKQYSEKYPNRFINFSASWFPKRIMFDEELADLPNILEEKVRLGCRGDGEIWKYLGLKTRDDKGKVIAVDDSRLDPLWEKAAELGIPMLWHMGDPAAFFLPVNRFNERYEELIKMSDWRFYGPRFPKREEILKQRENVLRKHSKTIFIGCHLGFNPDNLNYVGYLLDTYPNYYVEISAVLSDLGRQPFTARKFFIKYQDRILFASDGGCLFGTKGWTFEKYYRAYFEFLETDNEYFEYPMQGAINQGNWKIYGINLPDEVLEKIYYKNAEKILFSNKKNIVFKENNIKNH